MQTNSTSAVRQITVESLFGRYSYQIEASPDSNLLILYGDNGSGKTTILTMLFHILSTARGRGHLSELGTIPFTRFEVALQNGVRVFARRRQPSIGPFEYGYSDAHDNQSATDIVFDEHGRLAMSRETRSTLSRVRRYIEHSIARDVYYIADDRSLESDRISVSEPPDDIRYVDRFLYTRRVTPRRKRSLTNTIGDTRTQDLSKTLERATEWIRSQALDAYRVGTANTNQIYSDIITRIAAQTTSGEDAKLLTDSLLSKIDELQVRNSECEPFGLSSRFSGQDLTLALSRASSESRKLIIDILQPYLDSVEVRLDAVSPLQSRLHTFVIWVNRFLKDKSVRAGSPRGIEIFTDDDELLSPGQLSSGEQHLLLLLASTLYAQERPSLFVIDEPELSLNMKWQRQLPDALTDCTSGGSTQFVLATHSFEILANHQQDVEELKNLLESDAASSVEES